MNSSSSGKRLERFFTGKGFYIVLFLCAAVIGVSAWMMAAGSMTMSNENSDSGDIGYGPARTETIIVPSQDTSPVMVFDEPVIDDAGSAVDTAVDSTDSVEVWTEAVEAPVEIAAPSYIWPVAGDIDRAYHVKQLRYDATMCDWRTHDGVDIASPIGSSVCACRSGRVESIEKDDLFGTVVTVDHGDGSKAVYANLAEITAVNVDDSVQAGDIIGSVGATAIGESAQSSHLHFAMQINGESVDPLTFLNA